MKTLDFTKAEFLNACKASNDEAKSMFFALLHTLKSAQIHANKHLQSVVIALVDYKFAKGKSFANASNNDLRKLSDALIANNLFLHLPNINGINYKFDATTDNFISFESKDAAKTAMQSLPKNCYIEQLDDNKFAICLDFKKVFKNASGEQIDSCIVKKYVVKKEMFTIANVQRAILNQATATKLFANPKNVEKAEKINVKTTKNTKQMQEDATNEVANKIDKKSRKAA